MNVLFARVPAALVAVVAFTLVAAPGAVANVRIAGGETPYYARVESGEIFHDGVWAMVPFYRPPACVPKAFNLLDLFDVPGAFACGPSTIGGFTVWRNGPWSDPAPIQAKFHGLGAVPIWFVRWAELDAAAGDGVLTIGELAALPSLLVGSATFYEETLHPEQAATVGKLTLVARGTVADGRSFAASGVLLFAGGHRFSHVRIAFRERSQVR